MQNTSDQKKNVFFKGKINDCSVTVRYNDKPSLNLRKTIVDILTRIYSEHCSDVMSESVE